MLRFLTISALSLASVAALSAATITQIGSISSGAGGVNAGVNQGLTIASGVTDSITSGPAGFNAKELSYTGTLYAGATGVTYTPGNASDFINASVGSIPTGEVPNTATNQTLTAPAPNTGDTFDMIDEGGASTANTWFSSQTPLDTTTITVPVGIFGVTEAWTMLNDEWGINGSSPVTVTFNFGNSASVTNGDSISYTLVEGQTVRSAVDCTGSTGAGSQFFVTSGGHTGCESFATTLSGSSFANTGGTGTGTVSAFNVATGQYSGDTTTTTTAYNTSGTLFLDAQQYLFNSFSGDYLVNAVIVDTAGASLTNVNNTAFASSRVALSALDVSSIGASTPEPSTLVLLFTGIGILGLGRLRRRA